MTRNRFRMDFQQLGRLFISAVQRQSKNGANLRTGRRFLKTGIGFPIFQKLFDPLSSPTFRSSTVSPTISSGVNPENSGSNRLLSKYFPLLASLRLASVS